MENRAKTEAWRIGDILDFGKPVRPFLKCFLGDGLTLLDARQAYFDSESGMRSKIHKDYEKGEWLADVIETDDAKTSSRGLSVVYVQKPENVNFSADVHPRATLTEGGKRIAYNCPPTGWVVPEGNLLWHPETGAALATVDSKAEGVEILAKYIEKHPEQFKGWELPEKSYARFFEMFGGRCDPEKPTPKQLAELELSYQWAPDANSGVRTVRREFDKHCGPFCIHITDDLNGRRDNTGFRLRTRA